MTIQRNITVLEKLITPIIDITYGTDLIGIAIEIDDIEIPEGSTAKAFAIGPDGMTREQSCTISENTVSFEPLAGFFIKGHNVLQMEIKSGEKKLATFDIKVECHRALSSNDISNIAPSGMISSEKVTFDNSGSDLNSTNVEDALKELAQNASGLPEVTTDDNGKILRVVDGAWAVVDAVLAEELDVAEEESY